MEVHPTEPVPRSDTVCGRNLLPQLLLDIVQRLRCGDAILRSVSELEEYSTVLGRGFDAGNGEAVVLNFRKPLSDVVQGSGCLAVVYGRADVPFRIASRKDRFDEEQSAL